MIGRVSRLGDAFVEVKNENGEAQKFIPKWREGGPDKEMIRTFGKLKVGEWVKVEWVRDEHLRAVKIQTAPK